MQIAKYIATFMFSLSIAFAGVPVQAAAPECPMAKMMQEQQAQQMDMQDMEDCDGCDDMAKQDSKKSGCCDNATCNAKCSAMNSSTSMNLPSMKAEIPAINRLVQRFYAVDAMLASAHLNSQERPPKTLS